MTVRLLLAQGTNLTHYSSHEETAITWILQYGIGCLLMEPGELVDFAQGHKLLTNSEAKIVILQPGESHFVKDGDYAYIFFDDAKVKTCTSEANGGYWSVHGRKVQRNLPPI